MNTSANPASRCAECGALLGDKASEGLCPCCLLTAALQSLSDAQEPEPEEIYPASLLERREFGGYDLLEIIGRGGMGVVFKARQRQPARLVALKIIAAGELASSRMLARFRLEARAAASLHHPNIVPIFEVGEHRGWRFFSMQLVEGPTLASVIARQREGGAEVATGAAETVRSPQGIARLIVKLAGAVHQAHQQGILHRDLKPNNVLLDARGEPHLMDFGLAKLLEDDSSITLSKAVVGTPAYMAPEQVSGKGDQITVAADVYGLGLILYEALAGRPPFSAANAVALLRQIAENEPPKPSSINPGVPADLEVVCLKCLAKNPAQRYASAQALADDLSRWLRGEPIQARPVSGSERAWKWIKRNPARAGLLVSIAFSLIVVTVGSLVFNVRLSRAREAAEEREDQIRRQLARQHLREGSRLIEAGDAFAGAVFAVEALRQAEAPSAERQAALDRLTQTMRFSPRLLRLFHVESAPAALRFSDSGNQLLTTLRDSSVVGWNLASGQREDPAEAEALLLPASRSPEALPSPDAAWLAEARPDYTVRLLRRRDQRELAPALRHGAGVTALAFSPDGRWLATGSADQGVRLWDVSHPQARLYEPGFCVTRPLMAFAGDRFVAPDSSSSFRICGIATGEPLLDSLPAGGPLLAAAFDPANRHVASIAAPDILRIWDAKTGKMRAEFRGFGGADSWYSMEFSPGGDKLAVVASYGALLCWRIEDGTMAFPEQEFRVASRRVEWSKDGRWLLMASEDGVRVFDGATGKLARGPLRGDGWGFTARFSPDSQRLVASFQGTSDEASSALVWEAPSFRRIGLPLPHADGVRDVRFSPDNRFVVTSGKDNVIRVWDPVSGQPATPPMRHRATVHNSAYSADGRWLYSVDASGEMRCWESATGELLGPPLVFPSAMRDAEATASGDRLLARGEGLPGFLFQLSSRQRNDAYWREWAALNSGHELDAAGGLAAVPTAELEQRFAELMRRHLADFALPEDAVSWHEQRALLAEREKDDRAARFHLARLALLRPQDAEVAERLQRLKPEAR